MTAEDDELFNDAIEELTAAVYAFAEQHGVEVADKIRKNATLITLAGAVRVELGVHDRDRGLSGYVAVVATMSGSGSMVDGYFTALPTKAGLLGLIAGELGFEINARPQ